MANDSTPSNRLEEQATSKGDLSYSAWSGGRIEYTAAPKLIEGEIVADKPSEGVSAWNAAGTFESRDLTSWAEAQVKPSLMVSATTSAGATIEVTGVTSLSGDASVHHIRGKKRCGFDFEVKLAVKHTSGSQSHEGTLVFPSVGQDNLDDPEGLECAFEAKGTVGADDLRRVRKDCLALREHVCKAFSDMYESLKIK